MAESKKSYVVITEFTDLEDNRKIYHLGDTYPKPANKKVSDERIKQLLNHPNGTKYIQEK